MLNRTIARFLFYAVAIVLLVWTSSLTYSFLSMALPGSFWMVPLLGLVVFDVGMIAWLFVFLSHAEGAIQRATAIILCLFNFVGVGLMTISEILLSGQTMAAAPDMLGTIAIWGIGIWTTVNVLGVLVFHLGDNQARRAMAYQAEKDAIFDAALGDLKTRRIAAQKAMSEEISRAMMDELTAELRADVDNDGKRDAFERPGAIGKPVHNAPRHESEQTFVTPRELAERAAAEQGASLLTPEEVNDMIREAVARAVAAAPVPVAYPNGNGEEGRTRPR